MLTSSIGKVWLETTVGGNLVGEYIGHCKRMFGCQMRRPDDSTVSSVNRETFEFVAVQRPSTQSPPETSSDSD